MPPGDARVVVPGADAPQPRVPLEQGYAGREDVQKVRGHAQVVLQ